MQLIKRVKTHSIILIILSIISCASDIPKVAPCLIETVPATQCKHAEMVGDPKTLTFKQTDTMEDIIPGGYYIQPGGDNDFPHILVFARKEISACQQKIEELQKKLNYYEQQ